MTRTRPLITCTCCERVRPHRAHRWCDGCYDRWRKAGRPDDGPPPPRPRANNTRAGRNALIERLRTDARNRTTAYAELHDMGVGIEEAATRLDVTVRTIGRYRKQLGLVAPRTPTTVPEGTVPYRSDANQRASRVPAASRRTGHDFAYKRDLNANVADLSPEHLNQAVEHVEAFARDAAEAALFLEMVGLAEYVRQRAADALLDKVLDGAA